jgi:phage replication-related protein YjqB (UPF0714/DUF867 family)
MGKYRSYSQLRISEQDKKDYRIRFRRGSSDIAVIAPHGGGIEPGTTEIAEALAGSQHSFYSFEGWKQSHNADLHMTSNRFDEPTGLGIVQNARTVITVHGCEGREGVIYLGGLDEALKSEIEGALARAGFSALPSPRPELRGINPKNLCNRGRKGQGVQLEISKALRKSMFAHLGRQGRKRRTELFQSFVRAMRAVLVRT